MTDPTMLALAIITAPIWIGMLIFAVLMVLLILTGPWLALYGLWLSITGQDEDGGL